MQPRRLLAGSTPRCTLGCPLLDKLLRGGITCGSVTELVGEASAGKTQACLQLLVTCQWPVDQGGFQGKAMYMYTEGDPSLKRLLAIMSASAMAASPDNIYWERDIVDGEDLYERLQAIEVILRQPQGLPLRLLVIDSIAHLFRDIGDKPDTSAYVHRTGMLFRISAILRRFADIYNLAVVVTNQVSDAITETDITVKSAAPACKHTGGLRLLSSGRELVPALGLAWAHCVNTRLFLSRTEVAICSSQGQPLHAVVHRDTPGSLPLRYMQVVFSPCMPQDTCLYLVTQCGLQGIDKCRITESPQSQHDWESKSSDKNSMQQRTSERQPVLQPLLAENGAGPQSESAYAHAASRNQNTLATGVFALRR